MNVSNTKSKNLVLVSPLKQNLNKIRNWIGAPELIMAPLSRGGVEDTKLEAKDTKLEAKDTKKIRGQEQPFRGPTLSRPRAGMLETKDQELNAEVISKKKDLCSKIKKKSCPLVEDREVSRTCRLQGQGLQIVSLSTPPLPLTYAGHNQFTIRQNCMVN